MGVLYIVMPPTEEVVNWLNESGTTLVVDKSSRGPLISEIREILDSLDRFSVNCTDNGIGSGWQAQIESIDSLESGVWTQMNISSQGEPEEPQKFYFSKGHPALIVDIVSRLSERCGTFVIIPDTGCPPLIISPGDDPKKLYDQWKHVTSNV